MPRDFPPTCLLPARKDKHGDVRFSEKASIAFLEYMCSEDIVTEFFIETGNLPVRKSIMEREDVKTYLAENPSYQKMLDQIEYGRPAPSITKNIRDVFNRVNDMISRIIINGEDPQTVLDEYTAEFQSEIDELKEFGEFIY